MSCRGGGCRDELRLLNSCKTCHKGEHDSLGKCKGACSSGCSDNNCGIGTGCNDCSQGACDSKQQQHYGHAGDRKSCNCDPCAPCDRIPAKVHICGHRGTKGDVKAVKKSGMAWSIVKQQNLVSNACKEAKFFDKLLVNPWGAVVDCSQETMYVVNNRTATMSQLSLTDKGMPVVGWLPVTTPARPTGLVLNSACAKGGFRITNGGKSAPAHLIVVTDLGLIAGYNAGINDKSFVLFHYAQTLQVRNYKGACMLHGYLFVADFFNGLINKYDPSMNLVMTIPAPADRIGAGYSPFNVAAICGLLFVAFARHNTERSGSIVGSGTGFIDVYDGKTGQLVKHLIGGEHLNAPWGMVELAGRHRGGHRHRQHRLLAVGNFGDGQINIFDVSTGHFVTNVKRICDLERLATSVRSGGSKSGQSSTSSCSSSTTEIMSRDSAAVTMLTLPGLWALVTAPNHKGLYFTAGPRAEAGGLVGRLSPMTLTAPASHTSSSSSKDSAVGGSSSYSSSSKHKTRECASASTGASASASTSASARHTRQKRNHHSRRKQRKQHHS